MPQDRKTSLLLELLKRGEMKEALVFTRTKHRANRLADVLKKNGISAERIHGNRSQAQRTEALAAFKTGRLRVLVATDIAARGIDVEELGHVLNFDVPHVPEDYIHRVGRTARAEATGDAFTFVSPDEEVDLRAIEAAVGRRLPRVTLPGFDYTAKEPEKLEIPLAERIAQIRARKAEDRARAKANAERRERGAAEQRSREEAKRRADADRSARRGGGPAPSHGPRPASHSPSPRPSGNSPRPSGPSSHSSQGNPPRREPSGPPAGGKPTRRFR